MNAILDRLDDLSTIWWQYVKDATWQSGLVAGPILLIVWLGKHWPAPIRYGLLLLALAKFAVPPMLSIPTGLFAWAAPAVLLELTAGQASVPHDPTSPPEEIARSSISPSPVHGEDEETAPPSPSITSSATIAPALATPKIRLSWKTWLLLAHVLGCAALLTWTAVQLRRLRRLTHNARHVTHGAFHDRFVSVCRRLGIRRRVRLLLSSEQIAPVAFGVIRPAVMIPNSVTETLSPDEAETVLAHELAHHRRWDICVTWFQVLIMALWWFNPMVWLLNRLIRRTREDCCDDMVLAHNLTTTSAYCDTLLRVASVVASPIRIGVIPGLTEQLHPLAARLRRISDETVPRSAKLSVMWTLFLLLTAALFLPGVGSGTADVTPDNPSHLVEAISESPASEEKAAGDAFLDTVIRGPMVARGTHLRMLLNIIESGTGIHFVIDPGIDPELRFALQDPTVREILDTVLPGHGLDYMVMGQGVRIGTAKLIACLRRHRSALPKREEWTDYPILQMRVKGPIVAQETDLETIMTLLASEAGVHFTIDRGINPRVTFSLQNPTVGELLERVLPGEGLDYIVADSGTIRIGPAIEIATLKYGPDQMTVVNFTLKHVPVEYLKEVLVDLKSKEGEIIFDSKYNQVIVYDTLRVLSEMDELVKKLDKTPESMIPFGEPGDLLTGVIRLRYADAEDLRPTLQELTSGKGLIVCVPESNTIVVMDTREVFGKILEIVNRLDREPAKAEKVEGPIPAKVELIARVYGTENKNLDILKRQFERARSEHGRMFLDEESNCIVVIDTRDVIQKIDKMISGLEERSEIEPTPTPPRLAANYKIRAIIGRSAIILDHLLVPRVVREREIVRDPLGDFRIEEIDTEHERIRVKLLSSGYEWWITEKQAPRTPRRR